MIGHSNLLQLPAIVILAALHPPPVADSTGSVMVSEHYLVSLHTRSARINIDFLFGETGTAIHCSRVKPPPRRSGFTRAGCVPVAPTRPGISARDPPVQFPLAGEKVQNVERSVVVPVTGPSSSALRKFCGH